MQDFITADDRERFMAGDDRIVLADGIVIELHDDPDAWDDYVDLSEVVDAYVETTVEDPETGAYESLWGTGVPSGMGGRDCRDCRVMLWEHVVGGYYELLATVRKARAAELAERADAAARDIITV
jgi:hypothetical protein